MRLRLRQPPPDATPDGPRPLGSMVAAARRITGERLRKVRPASWQDEAWAHYDQVGELRYVANVLASQIARARIFAAYSPSSDEDPEPVDPDADDADPADRTAADVAASLCGGPLARAEVIRRIALHLFVPGDSLLVGLPPGALDANGDTGLLGEGDEVEFADLEWHALSPSEVSTQGSRLSVQVDDEARDVDASRALTVRVWRPHPRRWWEPDSPVRGNLPVLRELVGLTRHVSATIDSRLAGAGLLVVPDTITPLGAGVEDGQDTEGDDDPFVSALIEAMTTPIRDRDSAAAVVPLVARVPQDAVDAVRHIRFETQFDENARELRDEAIRRLALGIDAPPEVLTGVADVNHWCVDEDTEALTRRGWVRHDDLTVGDEVRALDHATGEARWTPVRDLYRADVTDEPMIALSSRTHSSLTTPDHRWPTVNAATGRREWRTSETLSATSRITTGAPADDLPTVAKYDDAFVELVAWFWTEGNITPDGRRASIAQSHTVNGDRVDRIRAALRAAFGPEGWQEVTQANDSAYGGPVTQFRLDADTTAALTDVAPRKRPTSEFVDALTAAQLRLFLDVSCQADGQHYRSGRLDVWQRDYHALDAFERAAILAGYATSRTPSEGGWRVDALRSSAVRPIKAAEETERADSDDATATAVRYTGTIWCPVTDEQTWLARRDGRTFYTGNTAWQVEDSVVTTHLEPVIAMICDALTTQLLWPVLSELGVDRPSDYVLWFDTSDLRLRPNRPSEARDLHSAGVLSDKALRKAVGFDEDDAPTRPEEQTPAVALALDLVRESPSLASDPGLGPLVEALAPLLGDDDAPLDDLPEPPAGDDDGGQPVPDGGPPGDAPPMPASGARR